MSEHVYHRSPRLFDVNGVIELLARAQDEIEGFHGFESGNLVMVKLHPETVASMAKLEKLRVKTLHDVQGVLPLSEDPFPVFRQVLEAGSEIGRKGQVCVNVGFEGIGCNQSRKYYDQSSIRIVRDVLKFNFSSHEAQTKGKGLAYGRELMRKVTKHPGLPLQFIDEEDGDFRLKHKAGGELRIMTSLKPLELNPVWFMCSLSGMTLGEAVDILARFVRDFGTSKHFHYSWEASPVPSDDVTAVSAEIYRTISAAPDSFKAKRYVLDADVHLDELADLEALRSLCGRKDRIVTALGYYRPSDVNWVALEIVTRADGHRLNVESRSDIDADELGATLGVDLEEGQWR